MHHPAHLVGRCGERGRDHGRAAADRARAADLRMHTARQQREGHRRGLEKRAADARNAAWFRQGPHPLPRNDGGRLCLRVCLRVPAALPRDALRVPLPPPGTRRGQEVLQGRQPDGRPPQARRQAAHGIRRPTHRGPAERPALAPRRGRSPPRRAPSSAARGACAGPRRGRLPLGTRRAAASATCGIGRLAFVRRTGQGGRGGRRIAW
mmetsp:Transcript_25871/g.60045  ORF Transcript_25871/g.60045 Transcript_25871/m.60045 type:complete len:208 (-) Transcript_25871:37-660(-)